jgi:hypothetical protein
MDRRERPGEALGALCGTQCHLRLIRRRGLPRQLRRCDHHTRVRSDHKSLRALSACQCPAVGGRKRCRLHGGLSPGAPRGARNGNWRHGGATNEAKAQRKAIRALLREARKMLDGDA